MFGRREGPIKYEAHGFNVVVMSVYIDALYDCYVVIVATFPLHCTAFLLFSARRPLIPSRCQGNQLLSC